jgi:hypothetical protein
VSALEETGSSSATLAIGHLASLFETLKGELEPQLWPRPRATRTTRQEAALSGNQIVPRTNPDLQRLPCPLFEPQNTLRKTAEEDSKGKEPHPYARGDLLEGVANRRSKAEPLVDGGRPQPGRRRRLVHFGVPIRTGCRRQPAVTPERSVPGRARVRARVAR